MNSDRRFMARALRLAERGRGRVHPNPLVGAVLVKNGRVIGEGAHLSFGGPHAEVNAIRSAFAHRRPAGPPRSLADATLYVTLEPCDHTGKTPPCTALIIRSRTREVVVGAGDPNPLVSGRGVACLKKAGIHVRAGILTKEAEELNRDYNHWMKHKMPYVTVKIAQSSDGYIAGERGQRPFSLKKGAVPIKQRWITGPLARRFGHRLRAASDAVIVGAGTVLADEPLLTVRMVTGAHKQPLRVVVDSGLRTSPDAKLFSVHGPKAPVCLATTARAPAARRRSLSRKAEILVIKEKNGRVDLKELLRCLGRRGIVRVLIEGGAQLWKDAFSRGLVNECYRFVSPKKMGGGLRVPQNIPSIRSPRRMRLGKDTLIYGEIK